MASDTSDFRNNLYQFVVIISEIDTNQLMRKELGDANFSDVRVEIENIVKIFSELKSCDFDAIPYKVIQQIDTYSTEINDIFKEIATFSALESSNPRKEREDIIIRLKNYYSYLVTNVVPFALYFKKNDIEKSNTEKIQEEFDNLMNIKNEFIETNNKFKAEIENYRTQGQEALNSITETKLKVEQTASDVGVKKHSQIFLDQAQEHKNVANKWLIGIWVSIASIIAFVFIIHSMISQAPNPETNEIIQFGLLKLIILSTLYFSTSICAKNYKANRHNYVLNKHKYNSLITFETFIKGAGEDLQTKYSVLLAATQSIFSNQPTGYSSNDVDNEPNKIIEIFKIIQGTKT